MPDWYHIALWVGPGGGGKTTGMVRDLIREMDLGTQYEKGYTNLQSLKHPKVERIKFEELKDLRGDLKKGRPTTLLCIDQLHKYMDARKSMSPRNIYMSDIVIESRQHGFDLRGTTWGKSSIDGRARKYLELLIMSKRTAHGFNYTMLDANNVRFKRLPTLSYSECVKYWKLFDMNELIEDVDPRCDPRIQKVRA